MSPVSFAAGVGATVATFTALGWWWSRGARKRARRRMVRRRTREQRIHRAGYVQGYHHGFDRCWELVTDPIEDEPPPPADPADRAMEEHYRRYGDG